MTLPSERTRAVLNTREFLRRLSSPYTKDGYKRIPVEVRMEARRLLRHFPAAWDTHKAAKDCPEVFDTAVTMRWMDGP
jgi:hypothetical protein